MGMIGGRTVKAGVGTVGGCALKRRAVSAMVQSSLDLYILYLHEQTLALEGAGQSDQATVRRDELRAAERTREGIRKWQREQERGK